MVFIISVIFFFLLFLLSFKKKAPSLIRTNSKKKGKRGLLCPVRGLLKSKKYDSKGKFTEEFQRIRLIKYLIKKGYNKEEIIIEHSIPIGHKGKNSLRADIVIKRDKIFLLVAEIKKNYDKESKLSAINHQLIPAMMILGSKKGIYFDGTKNSVLIVKNKDGTITEGKVI